jgi:hypothetical protein
MSNAMNMASGQPEEAPVEAIVLPFDPPQDLEQRIATAAYYKAEARGFEPGHEVEDWLAAEAELSVSD